MKTIRMKNVDRMCTVYEYKGWYAVRGGKSVNRINPDYLIEGGDVNDNTK